MVTAVASSQNYPPLFAVRRPFPKLPPITAFPVLHLSSSRLNSGLHSLYDPVCGVITRRRHNRAKRPSQKPYGNTRLNRTPIGTNAGWLTGKRKVGLRQLIDG